MDLKQPANCFHNLVLSEYKKFTSFRPPELETAQDKTQMRRFFHRIEEEKKQLFSQIEKDKGLILGKHVDFDNLFLTGKISVMFHFNMPLALLPHRHDFFELVYVYQGSIQSEIDGQAVPLQQDDLCLLNINAMHTMPEIDEDTIILNILLEKSLFNDVFFMNYNDDVIYNFFLDSLYQASQQKNYLLFVAADYAESHSRFLVHRLVEEFFLKKNNFQKAMEMYLTGLFIELTRGYYDQQTIQSRKELKSTDITEIIQYMKQNYATATNQSTAEHFNYHHNYLPRLIKKYTGKTFSEIMQTFKLNACKELLENTSLPIDEIVTKVGYTSKNHLYRIFKEETGLTPAQYRKNKRN